MTGFSADWLALREPADRRARSLGLTQTIVNAVGADPAPRILDLAAGTGSNVRYLFGRFPQAHWLLVDHDPALLTRVDSDPRVETRVMDLALPFDASIFDRRALVTASALLDLVSENWLRELVTQCALHGSAVLFALSYDGRIACVPADADDDVIVALVNEHQRGDKGFGPALGPDAAERAAQLLADAGYRVERERSDWLLTPDEQELQRRLIDGWAQAASEIAPQRIRLIDRWRERRLAHLAAGWSEITVGHEDMAAVAPCLKSPV